MRQAPIVITVASVALGKHASPCSCPTEFYHWTTATQTVTIKGSPILAAFADAPQGGVPRDNEHVLFDASATTDPSDPANTTPFRWVKRWRVERDVPYNPTFGQCLSSSIQILFWINCLAMASRVLWPSTAIVLNSTHRCCFISKSIQVCMFFFPHRYTFSCVRADGFSSCFDPATGYSGMQNGPLYYINASRLVTDKELGGRSVGRCVGTVGVWVEV